MRARRKRPLAKDSINAKSFLPPHTQQHQRPKETQATRIPRALHKSSPVLLHESIGDLAVFAQSVDATSCSSAIRASGIGFTVLPVTTLTAGHSDCTSDCSD